MGQIEWMNGICVRALPGRNAPKALKQALCAL